MGELLVDFSSTLSMGPIRNTRAIIDYLQFQSAVMNNPDATKSSS